MPKLSELHFFELEFDQEDASELRAALVWALHGFNAVNDNALGLDFSGTKVRVFGEEGALGAFFRQPRISRMAAMATTCKAPAPVPASNEAVYVGRCSKGMSPARQRRFARRNEGQPVPSLKAVRSDLVIPLRSKTNGNEFLLKLVRRDAPLSEQVAFTSYGTCREGSSLPVF